MTSFETIHIIWLIGCLVLAGSALAAYRLDWKTSLRHVLIWAVIISGLMLLISIIR